MTEPIIDTTPDTLTPVAPVATTPDAAAPVVAPQNPDVNADAPEAAEADRGFAQYREGGKGHVLEVPTSAGITNNWPEDTLRDFGIAAAREGFTAVAAQKLLNVFGGAVPEMPVEGFDEGRTLTELRSMLGNDGYDAALQAARTYTSTRPALSSMLEDSGWGNSSRVVVMLAALQTHKGIDTPAGAEKFLATLPQNKAYWAGNKVEVEAARIAFEMTS